MVLNYIWIGFFLIGFIIAVIKLFVFGDTEIFPEIMSSINGMAKTGFELSLNLTAVMSLWLGIMRIGEKGGMIKYLTKIVGPFFQKLFPDIPKNHPVYGSMLMNMSANMLGLDNAATPLGLKAMDQLQELNKDKKRASNSQIMFLVLNTSGLTLIPITIMTYRASLNAADPSDIFIPILLATFFSTLTGIIATSLYQRINLLNGVVITYLAAISGIIAGIMYFFANLSQELTETYSSVASNLVLFSLIITFILLGISKKINVYEAFIEGAKEGFNVAIKIIPYLIAILIAIGVFRTSGALDYVVDAIAIFFSSFGFNTEFVDALPTALMKPLSGGGARGMMIETMKTHGADSFVGRLSCVFQGSTETTFYVLALYFGSVGIKNTRYAVFAGLLADFAGIIAAIVISYMFFY